LTDSIAGATLRRMSTTPPVIPAEVVEATLELFDELDQAKDETAMQSMALRLGREQASILERAAKVSAEHGDAAGQAAVFYTTLVWTMFDRHAGLDLPRVTTDNVLKADAVVEASLAGVDDLDARAIADRVAPDVEARQPHLVGKLRELMAEDLAGEALADDVAAAVFPAIQVVVEAFDAALEGRRPGISRAPAKAKGPKVGRNEPCPCGSGKKHKRCCASG
jgi:hypothetical protein